MEVLKEVETRGRNPIYDFGISWKDNKTEYIKLYMRMVAKNKSYCEICDVKYNKYKTNKHLNSIRHQENISRLGLKNR